MKLGELKFSDEQLEIVAYLLNYRNKNVRDVYSSSPETLADIPVEELRECLIFDKKLTKERGMRLTA